LILRFLAVLLPAAAAWGQVTPGEILLSEMNCAACHEATPIAGDRLASRRSPVLGAEGTRLDPAWIREFLQDPAHAEPGTLMPDALHALAPAEKAQAAEALTQYLVSLQPAPAKSGHLIFDPETAKMGETLYHTVGCVACHAPVDSPPNAGEIEGVNEELNKLQQASVPLGPLTAKYELDDLAAFLRDPLRARPSGRMPSCKLTPEESRAIAMYLLREQAPKGKSGEAMRKTVAKPFKADAKKAEHGRELFAQYHCAACHGTGDAGAKARPLARLRARQPSGCLALKPPPQAPQFELSDRQRVVLLAALGNPSALELPLSPAHFIKRMMTTLNCYACHQRDRRGGAEGLRRAYFIAPTAAEMGDEGRLPPSLNKAGAKLQEEWIESALIEGATARPYLATRMPLYGAANLKGLPHAFVQADSNAEGEDAPGFPAESLKECGQRLAKAGGLSCVSCHALAGKPSMGSAGIDLTLSQRRMRWGWFQHYLLNPPSFHADTKMPSYWPEGVPVNKEICGGDTNRQIAALWLLSGDE
jgi:cytochrome c551/c552